MAEGAITLESLEDFGPMALDLLDKAKRGDAFSAGAVADRLRARGWNYAQIAAFALQAGIDGPTWESLLYESEESDG